MYVRSKVEAAEPTPEFPSLWQYAGVENGYVIIATGRDTNKGYLTGIAISSNSCPRDVGEPNDGWLENSFRKLLPGSKVTLTQP